MNPLHRLARVALLMALACAPLLGRGNTAGSWIDVEGAGPVLADLQPATMQQRCSAPPAGAGPGAEAPSCEYAFADRKGRRITAAQVIDEIEGYLSELPLLALWIAAPGAPDKGPGPYRLYLVAVDPAVVMAVPEPGGADWSCPGPPPQSGCLPSKRLQSNGYWFRLPPAIAPGSFWFVPRAGSGAVELSPDVSRVRIRAPSIDLNLSAEGSRWFVERLP